MRMAPVSADLLIKLTLGVLLVGGAVWAIRRVTSAASDAAGQVFDAAAQAVDSVNPLNQNNVFAQGANAVVSAATGREETFGGWLYDVTHPDPVTAPPRNTGGATGSW
jgi:hypothetical protein